MSHLTFLLLSSILFGIVRLTPANLRIVGGNDAIPKQFPHQVSLRLYKDHHCGGSIISNRYVLTAGHCVTTNGESTYQPKYLTVRVGSTNRYAGGIIVAVNRVILYPDYSLFNDIALLELKEDLIFSNTIQAIEIFDGEVHPNSEIIISGWGQTKHHVRELPIYLQYNELTSLSKEDCFNRIRYYTDAVICINHQKGTGACFGDSGGPATYNGKLVGVASFINAECGSSSADCYSNVTYNLNWIRKHVT